MFRYGLNGLAGLVAGFLLCSAPMRCFGQWTVEPVNTNGNSGWTLAIDLDDAGSPHIAYYDGSAASPLSYEVRVGDEWVKKNLVSYADAFALDNDGRAGFINTPSPNFYPFLQRRQDGGTLVGQQIAATRISEVSFLDFDAQNRPHIGYVQTSTQQLKHAVWNGTSWTTRTVATGPEFQYGNSTFEAALDPAGQVHFAWQNSLDVVRYAKPAGDSWQVSSPFPAVNGRPYDLAIDGAGGVHLAYDVYTGNVFTGGLFYSKYDGAAWTGGRVTGLDAFGAGRTKVITDSVNAAHLFTFDSTFAGPEVLKHLYRQEGAWVSETIDSTAGASSGPEDIAVAADSRGYHVLFSTGNKEVYYAYQLTGRRPGDLNGDGRVNEQDLAAWRGGFGNGAGGDGDLDGDTDGADLLVWQQHYARTPEPQTPIVVNGDFQQGGMSGWATIVTPNGSLSSGFPRVETFDVDGDGLLSSAMRIRVGQIVYDDDVPAGAGIERVIDVPVAGDYVLAADIASTNFDIGGNTSPGRFELMLDGALLDVVDFTDTTINPNQILRDTLSAELAGLAAGQHTLRLMIVRPGTNTRHIYQYVDDIALTPLRPASAVSQVVPEPGGCALFVVAGALTARRSRCRTVQ